MIGIDLNRRQGDVGRRILVLPHHLPIIHFVDVVSGKNHDVLRLLRADGINVLVHGIGRSLIPLVADPLHRRQYFDKLPHLAPENVPSLANVAIQRERLVLREDVDTPQIRIEAVGKGDIDDAVNAAERDRRLGTIAREGIESLAGTSC